MQFIACAFFPREDFGHAVRFLALRRSLHGTRVFSLPKFSRSRCDARARRDFSSSRRACELQRRGDFRCQNFFSHKRRENVRKTRIVIALGRIGALTDSRSAGAAASWQAPCAEFFGRERWNRTSATRRVNGASQACAVHVLAIVFQPARSSSLPANIRPSFALDLSAWPCREAARRFVFAARTGRREMKSEFARTRQVDCNAPARRMRSNQ